MSDKIKILNNTKQPLAFAGIQVSGEREAMVDQKAFDIFKRSPIGKRWLDTGTISVVDDKPKSEAKAPAKTETKSEGKG